MLNILNSFALNYTSIIFLHNSTPSLNLYIPLRGKSYWINITIIIISQNDHYIAQYLPVYVYPEPQKQLKSRRIRRKRPQNWAVLWSLGVPRQPQAL